MMMAKVIFTSLLIVPLLGGTAWAAEFFTSTLHAEAPLVNVGCEIVNIHDKDPAKVRIQVVDGTGTTVSDSGSFTLAVGASSQLDVFNVSGRHYCHFSASPDKVRTSIALFGAGPDEVALPGEKR